MKYKIFYFIFILLFLVINLIIIILEKINLYPYSTLDLNYLNSIYINNDEYKLIYKFDLSFLLNKEKINKNNLALELLFRTGTNLSGFTEKNLNYLFENNNTKLKKDIIKVYNLVKNNYLASKYFGSTFLEKKQTFLNNFYKINKIKLE